MTENIKTYGPLTPLMAVQLAAPHTWPASILPVLLATCIAATVTPTLSILMVCVLLAISILMQSAVNTMNDYYDYVKGSDSVDDNVEASDAVLVYNNVNPRSALGLAIGFLCVAFLLGIYVIWIAGFIPLFIALIGAFFVVGYSAGRTPISYMPIGEIVSGVVMGGLITLASFDALAGFFAWIILLFSIPPMIGIGLIMMTNNTCDIEKDIESGRKTLPVVLGRSSAVNLYHAMVLVWLLTIILIIGVYFTSGLIIMPFMVLTCIPLLNAMFKNPLVNKSRIGAMAQICSLNIALGAFYAVGILASGIGLSW